LNPYAPFVDSASVWGITTGFCHSPRKDDG
jgi:hypothetical protein